MSTIFRFDPVELPPECEDLRAEVREFIAGELPNTPPNLMRWIQHPRQVEAHTVMPEMGVTEQDSRDIVAYLYTLQKTP